MVARVGGDEFAVLLTDLSTAKEAENTAIKTAKRILAQFVTGFLIEGREVYTSTSIGIAIYPRDGQMPEELVRNSDMAMYAAKKGGKNNYHFYDSTMNVQAMERLIMESALRKALTNEEFELYYQPQCETSSGALAGLEVLLRWQHPRFGSLEPTQFLEMAEETELIIPIGEWVVEKAFETLAEWLSQGFDPGRLAINVSATQFKRSNFVEWLLWQVEKHDIDPHYIEVEITEHAVMEDVTRSLKILTQLSAAGIKIAIDDFGVGYSSLNYLRRFPVHTLKIDRDFVRDLVMEGGTQALTNAVIAIGKSLNLGVIAEGVETADQHAYLKEHGCDWVQGHYLSPPLSASSIMEKYFCNVLEEVPEPAETH
jgi:EAL domain-containing protein (putative c-di-GMP-specific phosphodiesterase class I)